MFYLFGHGKWGTFYGRTSYYFNFSPFLLARFSTGSGKTRLGIFHFHCSIILCALSHAICKLEPRSSCPDNSWTAQIGQVKCSLLVNFHAAGHVCVLLSLPSPWQAISSNIFEHQPEFALLSNVDSIFSCPLGRSLAPPRAFLWGSSCADFR